MATYIAGLASTHAAGFVLTRQEAAGKWKPATYSLRHAEAVDQFRVHINLKTAKALGLTIPESLLLRADKVVE